MTIEEFNKLKPYDRVYNLNNKELEYVQVIDLSKKIIVVQSGLYKFSELETEDYYIVNVYGIDVVKHAELVVINSMIDNLLEIELTDETLKTLNDLSKKKMEYHQDLNII